MRNTLLFLPIMFTYPMVAQADDFTLQLTHTTMRQPFDNRGPIQILKDGLDEAEVRLSEDCTKAAGELRRHTKVMAVTTVANNPAAGLAQFEITVAGVCQLRARGPRLEGSAEREENARIDGGNPTGQCDTPLLKEKAAQLEANLPLEIDRSALRQCERFGYRRAERVDAYVFTASCPFSHFAAPIRVRGTAQYDCLKD